MDANGCESPAWTASDTLDIRSFRFCEACRREVELYLGSQCPRRVHHATHTKHSVRDRPYGWADPAANRVGKGAKRPPPDVFPSVVRRSEAASAHS